MSIFLEMAVVERSRLEGDARGQVIDVLWTGCSPNKGGDRRSIVDEPNGISVPENVRRKPWRRCGGEGLHGQDSLLPDHKAAEH